MFSAWKQTLVNPNSQQQKSGDNGFNDMIRVFAQKMVGFLWWVFTG